MGATRLDAIHKHDLGVNDWQADMAPAPLEKRVGSSPLLLFTWVVEARVLQRIPPARPVTGNLACIDLRLYP